MGWHSSSTGRVPKPSEVLLEARELVARNHHTGSYLRHYGPSRGYGYCTVGAIEEAVVTLIKESGVEVLNPLNGYLLYDMSIAYVRQQLPVNAGILSTHDNSTHLENVVRLEKAALAAMKGEQ